MSLEPAVVYRTNDPAIVAAWDAELARRDALRTEARAYIASVDPDRRRTAVGNRGEFVILGLSHQQDWPTPAGWTAKRSPLWHVVPNRRTKAGKEAAAALRHFSPGDPRAVLYADGTGMPSPDFTYLDGAMRYVEPGVQNLGDWLYVTWAAEPTGPVDATRWETVSLSMYYAARESSAVTA